MKHAALAIVGLCVAVAAANPMKREPGMLRATGSFDVTLKPLDAYAKSDSPLLGRMSIDKQYHGDLEATARGEMLTGMTAVKESGVYVAVERVSGTLGVKRGTFIMHHTGVMERGAQPHLAITIVNDSGTDELAGISGTMTIDIKDGKHFYTLEYSLK